MKYILILTFVNAITTAEFNNKDACETAAEMWKRQFVYTRYALCVPKGVRQIGDDR